MCCSSFCWLDAKHDKALKTGTFPTEMEHRSLTYPKRRTSCLPRVTGLDLGEINFYSIRPPKFQGLFFIVTYVMLMTFHARKNPKYSFRKYYCIHLEFRNISEYELAEFIMFYGRGKEDETFI